MLAGTPALAQNKINVVATFSILGDLVSNVGGDRIEVVALVGPNSDTMGVPTAAAMCNGPVSPDTISEAARHSSTRSASRVGGARRAEPADAQ